MLRHIVRRGGVTCTTAQSIDVDLFPKLKESVRMARFEELEDAVAEQVRMYERGGGGGGRWGWWGRCLAAESVEVGD